MWLLLSYNNSVNVEMSLLLLLLLVLSLSNLVSSKPSGLEKNVKEEENSENLNDIDKKVEKLIQRMERMDILEKKLEAKNMEVENLQKQLKEVKVQMAMQMADLQNQLKEVKAQKNTQSQEVAKSLKSEMTMQWKAEFS